MRSRTPLVLLAVALSLGAYLVLIERHQATTDETIAIGRRLLPGLDRARVTRVVVARDGVELALRRTAEGEWRFDPGGELADTAEVDGLLGLVEGIEVDRSVVQPRSTVTGLQEPRVVVEIDGRRLRMGAPDATGQGVYVQRDGDGSGTNQQPALVVSKRLLELVDRPPEGFRDRRVLPAVDPAKVHHIMVRQGGARSSVSTGLERRGELWWAGPIRVETQRVEQALADLAASRAHAVLSPHTAGGAAPPETPAALALNLVFDVAPARGPSRSGSARVEIWPEAATCTAGSSEGRVAHRSGADSDGTWLCLRAADVANIERAFRAATTRDLRLLPGRPEDVIQVSLTADGSRRLILRRHQDGTWRTQVPPAADEPADARVVGEWLADLATFRLADQQNWRRRHGDVQTPVPEAVLALVDSAGRAETVRFSRPGPGGGKAPVRVDRQGESAPAAASSDVLALLAPDPLRFRPRSVLSFARYDARRVTVESAGVVEVASKGAGEVWRIARPDAPEADAEIIDALVAAFADLVAERFLPDDPSARVARRTITVEVQSPRSGVVTHRLEIFDPSKNGGEGCLARLATARGPVFLLSAATCRTFATPLVPRKGS